MHLSEKKYKIWQSFQEEQKGEINKRDLGVGILKPLPKYPKSVPDSYIVKITNLEII